jgi:type VI protein secretion system component Hcp
MPSDAYLELYDPSVWGETHDSFFGMQGRAKGAFEISSFKFGVSAKEDDETKKKGGSKAGQGGTGGGAGGTGGTGGHAAGGRSAAKQEEPTLETFTITKYIDKASPDLFLACLQKDPFPERDRKEKWAYLTVRESGEAERKPYLVIEFQGIRVKNFQWDIKPGDAEAAEDFETVEFSFETVLIKYSRQEPGGAHQVVKIKGWNRMAKEGEDPTDVQELDFELIAGNIPLQQN